MKIDYPLLFEPINVEKVWAGDKLSKIRLSKETKTGEAWDVSTVATAPDDASFSTESIIKNGSLAGKKLSEFVDLPVVVKVIDSGDKLSVQNHPNKKDIHKNEMWFIMASDDDSYLYYGIEDGITKKEFCDILKSGNEEKILSSMKYFKKPEVGSYFNVPTGTVHALGPGLLTFEISEKQQVTYRLYDYMRKRSLGKLDIDVGCESILAPFIDFTPLVPDIDTNKNCEIITSFETFATMKMPAGEMTVNRAGQYHLISAIINDCEILSDDERWNITIPYTYTCLIPPTETSYKIKSNGTVLISPILL